MRTNILTDSICKIIRTGKGTIIKSILLIGLVILLISCHSEYVCLDYDIHHDACWDNGHSLIAFVASKIAYRNATGIAKFPDGGIPDYLLQDVGLYVFNPENLQLIQVVDFNDLVAMLRASRSNWRVKIAFKDSVLYYHILPLMEWAWYLKQAKTAEDSMLIGSLQEKYNKMYSFTMNQKKVGEIDSSSFSSIYQEYKEEDKINLSELNKKLSEVPMADWGLMVKDIYPKPDNEYIEETIYLRNGSSVTRRAVVEQIIAKMSKQEIKELLKNMDEYKNSLEGLKRTEYEIYSKDTYEKIQELL